MEIIGIIGAMDVEVDTLKKDMKVKREVQRAGMTFCQGELCGQEAVVVRSGVGKVNAAICTQILIDEFHVTAVVNTGIAGALKDEINISDLVISTDLVQHDMDATGFGYPLGQIPQMEVFSFQADERLSNLAKKACEEVNPEIQVFQGRIVSGDQFVSDRAVKEKIAGNFDGYCTEMEGAAIAQAAYLNGVPFVVVRAVSDKADESAAMDYPAFERMAVEHSVKLVERFMTLLK